MITVALPYFKASEIVWVALEGLCRQENAPEFELIVYEDGLNTKGKRFYQSYADRLAEVGCAQIQYIGHVNKVPLPHKWKLMSEYSEGELFCMQAADDMMPPNRLAEAWRLFKEGYDWTNQRRGYFYHIKHKKIIQFDQAVYGPGCRTGLNMNIDRKLLKLDFSWAASSVDKWMFESAKPKNMYWIEGSIFGGVQTDGMNTISMHRNKMYLDPKKPFVPSALSIFDVVPKDIAERLYYMK